MDGGAWWAAVHGVAESWTQLSDFTFAFHFHALEKEMATHSSVLAWRIPGTGEPGGLLSMGSHRVGHDWSDLAAAAACFNFIILKPFPFLFYLGNICSEVNLRLCLLHSWQPSLIKTGNTRLQQKQECDSQKRSHFILDLCWLFAGQFNLAFLKLAGFIRSQWVPLSFLLLEISNDSI